MSKVQTAKDLLESKGFFPNIKSEEDNICEIMIEFARLHVREAVKACIEDAPSGSSTDPVYYEDVVANLEDSYPDYKIK